MDILLITAPLQMFKKLLLVVTPDFFCELRFAQEF